MFNNYKGIVLLMGLFLSLNHAYSQQITVISPATGLQGQTLSVSITGSGTAFQSSGTINKLWLNKGANSIAMTSLLVIDDEHIDANLSLSCSDMPGLWDVVYTDLSGTDTLTLSNGFDLVYVPPLSVSPDSACIDEQLTFAITAACGISFQSSGTTNNLWLNDGVDNIFMVNITILDSTNLTADVDLTGATPGAWDVVWTNSLGDTIVLVDSFWVDSCITGIEGVLTTKNLFSIYPNPASSRIFLELKEISAVTQVSIYDLQGTLRYSSNTIQGSRSIDVSQLPPAVYLLRLTAGKHVFVKKFTVQE